ncbi:MAG: hypothetical protein ACKVQA_01855 [Burkholderiales bacterium]
MSETDILEEGTLARQRRNLLVTCIVLLVYYLGGGAIEPHQPLEVSVVLGKVALKNPSVLLWLLWTAFFYFLWRYWLYARKEHGRIWTRYREMLDGDSAFGAQVRRLFDIFPVLGSKGLVPLNVELAVPSIDPAEIITVSNLIKYKRVGMRWVHVTAPFHRQLVGGTLEPIQPNRELTIQVPLTKLVRLFARNYRKAALGQPAFSDLMTPYCTALATLVVGGYHVRRDVMEFLRCLVGW